MQIARVSRWRAPRRVVLALLGATAMLVAACGATAAGRADHARPTTGARSKPPRARVGSASFTTPAVRYRPCRLSLRYTGSTGGAGVESAGFQVRNRSTTACPLYRYPLISLFDHGRRIHVAQTDGAPHLEPVLHPVRSLSGGGRAGFVFFYAPMNPGNGRRCRPVATALEVRFAAEATVQIRLPTALNPLREQINPCGGGISVTPLQ
jgi:hypothetical protein